MSKSYEEILEYSKKIILRGDGWKSVVAYLEKNCNNLLWREEIIQKVKEYHSANREALKKHSQPRLTNYDIVLGYGGIAFGIVLLLFMLYIEDNAIWIGILPFIFIGLGIKQLAGKNK